MRKESPASGKVVIKLPLPPAALTTNPKKKLHWSVIHDARVSYRELATVHAKNAMRARGFSAPFQHRAQMHILVGLKGRRYHRNTYAPRDAGNAVQALKSAIDGIVNAGLLADDDGRYLSIGSVVIDNETDEGITLTFEEVLSSAVVSD